MNETSHTSSSVWTHPVHLLAFGFGTGLAPRAPGTAGTLVGVAAYVLLMRGLSLSAYLMAIVALFLLGIWLCGTTARSLGVHDHPGIVWDEIVGFLITMIAAPAGWIWVVAGFAAFRFFDIVKPWPIRLVDRRVSGGLGIMLDDLLAGLFSLATLWVAASVLGVSQ